MSNSSQLLKLVGGNIRRIRKKRGFPLEKVSVRTGLNVDYISRVERGLQNISLVSLHKIAKVLDADIQVLLQPHNENEDD